MGSGNIVISYPPQETPGRTSDFIFWITSKVPLGYKETKGVNKRYSQFVLNFTETFFNNWSKFKPCPQKLQSAVPRPRPNPDHSCTRSTVRSCSNSLLTAALNFIINVNFIRKTSIISFIFLVNKNTFFNIF